MSLRKEGAQSHRKNGMCPYFPMSRREIYLVLACICLIVYANSLNNPFISDDIPAILENPHILEFQNNWLNPQDLLNSLSYLVSGQKPFLYHFISILIHILNTCLVFLLLNLFFKTDSSFWGSCLFAVHPIHVEAVAWVSGRTYLILGLFILSCYLFYHRSVYVSAGDKKFAPIAYLLSLGLFSYYKTKEFPFFFVFPFLLILSDVFFKGWRKNWKLWVPFFVILILKLILAGKIISHRLEVSLTAIGPPERNPLVYFAYSFYSYLGLLIFPFKLALFHTVSIPPVLYKYTALFLLPVIFLLYLTFRKAKEVFLGLCIFILFLAPTYSPIPVGAVIAERYCYFPSLALSIFIAFLYEKLTARNRKFKSFLLAILILLAILYGVRTIARNNDWANREKFWQKELRSSAHSPRVHNNMGMIYLEKGEAREAIAEFEKAIAINPQYAPAYNNLALAYIQLDDKDKAIGFFKKTIEINPDYREAYFNLSLAYFYNKQYGLAIEYCDKAAGLGYPVPAEFLESLKIYRKR